jgi:hypothetical protein
VAEDDSRRIAVAVMILHSALDMTTKTRLADAIALDDLGLPPAAAMP